MTILVLPSNSATGYNLTKSLRFRSSASAYLSRSAYPSSSATTWTFSFWMKLGTTPPIGDILSFVSTSGAAQQCGIGFTDSGGTQISFWQYAPATYQIRLIPSMLFRDPSAWYHVVVVYNSSNATASNRAQIYVNGVLQTAFTSATYPSLNLTSYFNNGSHYPYLGAQNRNNGFLNGFDGYLAEINFIDGQALSASSFGSTNSQTGVWQPARYTGTYGTNGFYLPFTNTTSTSTLGNDFSGNGNNWTVNNISLTSGSTYDSMTDVPTNTNSNTANYCVLNPLDSRSGNTISNGNLQIATGTTAVFGCRATVAVSSGKWYWEMTPTANVSGAGCDIGIDNVITPITTNDIIGFTSTSYGYRESGQKVNNGSSTSYGSSYTTNDIIGIALDLDAGTLVFYKNNVSQGTAFTGISGTFTPAISDTSGGQGVTVVANFGQQPFAYTPPTGFVALNTFNLPTPTVGVTASSQANKYFDATLYTGNGSTQTITNAGGFQPDLVWAKVRSNASWWHILVDSVRGVGRTLSSNVTNAEIGSGSDCIPAFNSNGFNVNVSPNASVNENGATYVAWQWRASNATAVTNTAGSITSTVSANTTAGFSIVTYTGTGANATVGHGLGVAPRMIIIKNRGDVSNWPVWHSSLSGNSYYLYFNRTDAQSNVNAMWNNTAPTSTVFSLGTSTDSNDTRAMVAYCFAQIAGYSAFGSYTGNGSSDGTFVYTGFRPRYVMTKRTDSSFGGDWYIYDAARDTYNVLSNMLYANGSAAESSVSAFDFLSNGFKVRSSAANFNASGGTYIYMAFAESPFKYANAR